MDLFLRRLSLLLVPVVLAGCGQARSGAPSGHPYPVIIDQSVIAAPAERSPSTRHESGGGSGSWIGGTCDLGGHCSGKDALVGVVVVLAVVIVVGVVVCVVDAATPEAPVERYYLTLSGDGVPLAVVTITTAGRLYLDDRQYDALQRGAYTRAVIRPAVWEGTSGAPPTQAVRVTVEKGGVVIAGEMGH